MIDLDIFLRFLLAMGVGALAGTERERFAKRREDFLFGGIRAFTFISLLGAICGVLSLEDNKFLILGIFIGFAALLAISYHHSVVLTKGKGFGLTGEIAAILMFLVGYLISTEHLLLGIALGILIALVLYLRQKLHDGLNKISEEEMYSTLVFAVIALVVLPFLPDNEYGPLGVLNPHKIWLMIVLICGIGYVGYVLTKIFGSNKGIGLTGLLGGLASSTAVTMTMAQKSKDEKSAVNMLVFATIIANTVMFVRVAVVVAILNAPLLIKLLPPLSIMALAGLISAAIIWFMSHKAPGAEPKVDHKSPFRIGPALKFGIFFALILFFLKVGQIYFGSTGIYIASILSGFVDVDAVTLSMATISGFDTTLKISATAIILAVMSNTIIKIGYSAIFGSKEFSKKLSIAMISITVLGLFAVFLF